MSQISQLKFWILGMHSESRTQGRCKDLRRPCFSFSLASSSVEAHISVCVLISDG